MSGVISRLKAQFFGPTLRSRAPNPKRSLERLAILAGLFVIYMTMLFLDYNLISFDQLIIGAAGVLLFCAAEFLPRGRIVLANILRLAGYFLFGLYIIIPLIVDLVAHQVAG